MKRSYTAAAAAFLAAATFSPAGAQVVIGTADNGNGIPFGNTLGGYYYQQVYNAAAFGSGLNIGQISFYNSRYPGGQPRGGNFEIFLSTTSAAIPTFDTNTSAPWYDPSFTQVFSGSLPAIANGRLDLNLSSAFNYIPAQGNLLLTVREFTLSSPGGSLFLDTDANNGLTNSRFSAYPYEWNQGLVTGFNVNLAPVPEPATWAMMIGGFGLVGGAMRSGARKAARAAYRSA